MVPLSAKKGVDMEVEVRRLCYSSITSHARDSPFCFRLVFVFVILFLLVLVLVAGRFDYELVLEPGCFVFTVEREKRFFFSTSSKRSYTENTEYTSLATDLCGVVVSCEREKIFFFLLSSSSSSSSKR